MKRDQAGRGAAGFTLLEVTLVVALIGIAVLIGFPALQKMIVRSELEGVTRTAATFVQQARFESIRSGSGAVIRVDLLEGEVVAFVDENDDNLFQPATEKLLGRSELPKAVSFSAPSGETTIFGFDSDPTAGWAVMLADGSIRKAGAFRFGDVRGNFLEVRVEPAATARVQVRKWNDDDRRWYAQGQGGKSWEWKT
jgi:prepilin-type N-terminal cleavage/methylation domain-containing protein